MTSPFDTNLIVFYFQKPLPKVVFDEDEDEEDEDEDFEAHHHSLMDAVDLELATEAVINAANSNSKSSV